ncbi:rhodanese-like domain-containing protein [Thermomonas brevis]
MSKTAADLVAAARGKVRELSPAQAQAELGRCVLIDVREPAEFATGHLRGAANIPRGVLEFQVEAHPAVANVVDPALSQKQQPVLVYCRTGGRAALAAVALQELGFSDVRSIEGGITAWIDAGLPLDAH